MSDLKRTVYYDLHLHFGARMVAFAGYEMPVQYKAGVLKEHLQTRNAAGLFDVSHMGQVILRPKSGRLGDAAAALERLVPADVIGLPEGRQRYTFLTNDDGGLRDDLMFANRGDHLFLVVNAGCKVADIAYMRKSLSDACTVEEVSDRALIAVQGPGAEAALASINPGVRTMRFMDVADLTLGKAVCWVSRSGYTGEDGFEISVPGQFAVDVAKQIWGQGGVEPIGLGARDTLRLEAGLCLYGHDIDPTTSPVEAALDWAIPKARRTGGTRAGGFPGAARILSELENGVGRRRVGLLPQTRAPMREGTRLFADEAGGQSVGSVTSGAFGPSLQAPVSMGYVETALAASGTQLFGEVRGKRLSVRVADLPFLPPRFKR